MLEPMMKRINSLTQMYKDIKQELKILLEPLLGLTNIPTWEEDEQDENIPKESEQDVDKVENID